MFSRDFCEQPIRRLFYSSNVDWGFPPKLFTLRWTLICCGKFLNQSTSDHFEYKQRTSCCVQSELFKRDKVFQAEKYTNIKIKKKTQRKPSLLDSIK